MKFSLQDTKNQGLIQIKRVPNHSKSVEYWFLSCTKRIFTEYIGANPKDYLRIVRFQRALHILQINPQISLTQLAYECDYYDQSHLIKEFKIFSGYTPGEYLAICAPYSDYFS